MSSVFVFFKNIAAFRAMKCRVVSWANPSYYTTARVSLVRERERESGSCLKQFDDAKNIIQRRFIVSSKFCNVLTFCIERGKV